MTAVSPGMTSGRVSGAHPVLPRRAAPTFWAATVAALGPFGGPVVVFAPRPACPGDGPR